MKLFLCSEGVTHPDMLKALLEHDSRKFTVALICNAQDIYPSVYRAVLKIGLSLQFTLLGFKVTYIDLRDFSQKDDALYQRLKGHGLIWCSGGNSFRLRYVMRESGFDACIRRLLDGGVVYGGWSAGAVVAGVSLHPIELMDDPQESPEVLYGGLGLIDCVIWPHWNKSTYARLQGEAEKYFKQTSQKVIKLRDGDIVIVDDDRLEVVASRA